MPKKKKMRTEIKWTNSLGEEKNLPKWHKKKYKIWIYLYLLKQHRL